MNTRQKREYLEKKYDIKQAIKTIVRRFNKGKWKVELFEYNEFSFTEELHLVAVSPCGMVEAAMHTVNNEGILHFRRHGNFFDQISIPYTNIPTDHTEVNLFRVYDFLSKHPSKVLPKPHKNFLRYSL